LVLDELAPLLDETNVKNKTGPVDAEKILELFEKLEPLLKNRDTACLKLLDDLNAVPGTEELAYQIEEFNFKLAFAALEKLKKTFASTQE
jgi:hypothetical protein